MLWVGEFELSVKLDMERSETELRKPRWTPSECLGEALSWLWCQNKRKNQIQTDFFGYCRSMVVTKLMLMVVRRKFVVSPGLGGLWHFLVSDPANHWQFYFYSTRQISPALRYTIRAQSDKQRTKPLGNDTTELSYNYRNQVAGSMRSIYHGICGVSNSDVSFWLCLRKTWINSNSKFSFVIMKSLYWYAWRRTGWNGGLERTEKRHDFVYIHQLNKCEFWWLLVGGGDGSRGS